MNRLFNPRTENVIRFAGIPDVAEDKQAVFRARLQRDINEFMRQANLHSLDMRLSCGAASSERRTFHSTDRSNSRIEQFTPAKPKHTVREWIIPAATRAEIENIKGLVTEQRFLEEEWGFAIRPAVVFTGPPGVGKTMGAHVVARELGKPIITSCYSHLESKYPGEGAENVRELFRATDISGAVLFLDEAENALGPRIPVTHGAEQAINSIKTTLLNCLDEHRGLVICATNKIVEFDEAFRKRMQTVVDFQLPDEPSRERLWSAHLCRAPKAADVDISELGHLSAGFAGRDISFVCNTAGVLARKARRNFIQRCDLLSAIEFVGPRRKPSTPLPQLSGDLT